MKARALFSIAVVIAAIATPTTAQQVVDLDARVHSFQNPVTVTLSAGCWRITPVQGGFTAWHPWNGSNTGCGVSGPGCTQGWCTLFNAASPSLNFTAGTGFYPSASQALGASGPRTFWLAQQESVALSVADQPSSLFDNLGGVSLLIEPLPGCGNPATLATYGSGTTGSAGTPAIGASGLPYLGDTAFEVQLASAPADAPLVWLLGATRANAPLPIWGATLLVTPLLSTPGAANSNGDAQLAIPLDCSLGAFCGSDITAQAVVLDAGALGGLSFSGGLELTIGS